jgi:hypothetical protein
MGTLRASMHGSRNRLDIGRVGILFEVRVLSAERIDKISKKRRRLECSVCHTTDYGACIQVIRTSP